MPFSRRELLLLLLIVAAASLLRLYRLDQIPVGLCADTAYKGVAANRILQGQRPIFFAESWGGVEPMYMYIVAAFMRILGMTPLVLKAVSATVGIITVPVLYLLARELFSSATVGLLASSWLAISYWHLNYSRLGWEIILVPLFVSLTLHLLWRGLKSGRWRDFAFAGASLGASLYTYQASRFLPVLVVLYLCARGLVEKGFWRAYWIKVLLCLATALVVLSPLGAYVVTHPDDFLRQATNVSIFNPELNGGSPLRALATSTVKTIAMFHLLPDPSWRQNPAMRAILDPLTGLLFLAGLAIALIRWRQPGYLLVLIWIPIMSLPAVLTASGLPHSSRTIGVLPVVCILPAIAVARGLEWLKRRQSPQRVVRLFFLGSAILLLLVALSTYIDYFTVWDKEELRAAFDMPFVKAAEVMNSLSRPGGVWILPLTSLADPGTVDYTIEFLYRGDAPHHFLRLDESNVAQELSSFTVGEKEAWVIEWDESSLGGAYRYHSDPKGVLRFLLTKYGRQLQSQEFQAFDIVSYQLPEAPSFTIADSFQPLSVKFGDQVALVGAAYGPSSIGTARSQGEVKTEDLRSGQQAWVALQWQALASPASDYKAAIYLVDGHGRLLGQMDKVMLSNDLRMTSQWRPGQVEMDYYTVPSPPATPPGTYHIEVVVYDSQTMERLPVVGAEGRLSGQSFSVGTINVVEPLEPPQVTPEVSTPEGDIAPGIRLLGYDLPRHQVEPGATVQVGLYWQALQDIEDEYVLTLEIRDQAGVTWAHQLGAPVDGTYPTTEWEEGEVLRDWHDVQLPPDTPQGRYQLLLEVMGGPAVSSRITLGEIEVRGRTHSYALPEIEHPLELMLGENVRLLGYDLDLGHARPGGIVGLTLYWQAVAEMGTSYTVFTHLLDGSNQIRGQRDNIPGNGALPTTGWLKDEVVTDLYELDIDADAPPGDYVLEMGMYYAPTSERLAVHDLTGRFLGDRVLLPSAISLE